MNSPNFIAEDNHQSVRPQVITSTIGTQIDKCTD